MSPNFAACWSQSSLPSSSLAVGLIVRNVEVVDLRCSGSSLFEESSASIRLAQLFVFSTDGRTLLRYLQPIGYDD